MAPLSKPASVRPKDADGTYPPEHFPSLCIAAMDGAELVVGSRMAGEESKMPITRRIGNLFFATLLTLVGRQRVSDSASGMRVFKREILDRIYPLPDGLNLTPVMSVRDGSIFLHSIVWTVLTYNPVRILGMIGLGGVGLAGLVGGGLVAARLSGITSLGPWGVAAVFVALVAAVAGISLFSLGTTFNYLVSLFYKRPVRQGLFGRPIFNPPLDHHFGWMGLVSMFSGVLVALISLALGIRGWEIARLWLYLLGSAMMILVGIQLSIYWVLVRVLAELSEREILAQGDMRSGA